MRENTDQKNSVFGHFSRSEHRKYYNQKSKNFENVNFLPIANKNPKTLS